MTYSETTTKLSAYRQEIAGIREKMRILQAAIEPEAVEDYEFSTRDGKASLSSLFGDKNTLFVIHNMGTTCSSCTMWADGFNGVFAHLADRAAFVVSSPDPPKVQQEFAAGRGWTFPMVSHQGTSFAQDMGYVRNGGSTPGVSVFKRQDGRIVRVGDTGFMAGDDFCGVWHLFDLTPEGAAGWRPKFRYAG